MQRIVPFKLITGSPSLMVSRPVTVPSLYDDFLTDKGLSQGADVSGR